MQLVRNRMGWWHSYYAEAVARSSLGTWLCLYVNNVLAGTAVMYVVPSRPAMGVVYYIVIDSEFEGRGLGKVMLASSEEILEAIGCKVTLASTSGDNVRSRNLFKSMGYREVWIDEMFRLGDYEGVELVVRALCCFEDDVVLIKGIDVRELLTIVKRSKSIINRIWREICYEPWRRLHGYR